MINFMNDYNSPGHPDILRAVAGAAHCKYPGYGDDPVSEIAKQKIVSLLGGRKDASVHFLAGGTQVNLTAASAFLRPHEAVVAAGTAHVQVHETGAIEATGHRILLADEPISGTGNNRQAANPGCGKLTADGVRRVCKRHAGEHMVKPRLVYISQSTELGGVYSLSELQALRAACDEYGLLLYMDGARLAIALTAPGNDAGLPDIAELCDAFYIGGTKNGLMFGEALVIVNDALNEDFRFMQKQRGGLLAKGFLLGLQFGAIFEDDLFFKLAEHANKMAARLRLGLEKLGLRFYVGSLTNQIFPVLRDGDVKKLEETFFFETWETIEDGYTAVRFVTSWNTTEEDVDALLSAIGKITGSESM